MPPQSCRPRRRRMKSHEAPHVKRTISVPAWLDPYVEKRAADLQEPYTSVVQRALEAYLGALPPK